MIGSSANSFQVNTDAAKSAAQIARTQNEEKTQNRAAVEQKVENRVESDVKREQAGKSAAEQMRKENTAFTTKPEDGIELEISKKGLQKEKDALQAEDKKKPDEKSATEQRVEEQQKVKARIREQVEKELKDEKTENKQVERREEDKKDREQIREKVTQGEEEDRKQQITNYAGYTNAQLQQMAQNGEISQNDYKAEIEKREEKLEQTQQGMRSTDRELAKDIGRMEKVERQTGVVEKAFDEESNQNINAETRAEIVQNLENPQKNTLVQEDNQRDQQARAYAQWQNDFGFLIR